MTTNPDLDQARKWAKDPSYQGDVPSVAAAHVIASLPDEWIDADKLREALDWRDSKPSGYTHPYDGEFYDRLRDLLPGPPLPDPLFLAKATHPEYGEGVVISARTGRDGYVRFMSPDERYGDGTSYVWVYLSTLTFRSSDMSKNGAEIDISTEHVDPIDTRPGHPEFLETEEDYRNAPEGTIVVKDKGAPFALEFSQWRHAGPLALFPEEMAGVRRRVLRWGWEA